jgi:hypothetical protein
MEWCVIRIIRWIVREIYLQSWPKFGIILDELLFKFGTAGHNGKLFLSTVVVDIILGVWPF